MHLLLTGFTFQGKIHSQNQFERALFVIASDGIIFRRLDTDVKKTSSLFTNDTIVASIPTNRRTISLCMLDRKLRPMLRRHKFCRKVFG